MEILIWNECARLVGNTIIYYKAFILSQLVEIKEKQGDKQAIEFLKRISTIAWQHINLLGMYDFSLTHKVDVGELSSIMFRLLDLELSKIKS